MNGQALLMTSMLGIILIYIYSTFAFIFIKDTYYDDDLESGLLNRKGDSICQTMLHCFLSTLHYGMRGGGGVGDFLPDQTAEEFNISGYYFRQVFDFSFFVIIITILLNIIFGIIIDTFAQLREKSHQTQQDIKNTCFICSLDRYTLDRDTEEGFDYHTNTDHVIWNYCFFIIHLQIKDKTDFNGTESEIYSKLQREDVSWFPMHKSIRLMKELRKRLSDLSETNQSAEMEKTIHTQLGTASEHISTIEQLLC